MNMTIEEKAKAYDIALERIKSQVAAGLVYQDVSEYIFPELAESDDEKIRKLLISFFDNAVKRKHNMGVGVSNEEIIAWLEKQKETDRENDFTIYHPLKNNKGKYECFSYSFHGSLTSFSKNKDLMDFLRNCFYTEKECQEWIEKQGEQNQFPEMKTAEESFGVTSEEYNGIINECIFGEQSAEWSEEDKENLIMCCKFLHDASLCIDYDVSHKEDIAKCIQWLKSLKPQPKKEWSEEDESAWVRIIDAIEQEYTYTEADELKDWLKSLRHHNSWKPTNEQLTVLLNAGNGRRCYLSCKHRQILLEIYEELKKL